MNNACPFYLSSKMEGNAREAPITTSTRNIKIIMKSNTVRLFKILTRKRAHEMSVLDVANVSPLVARSANNALIAAGSGSVSRLGYHL